MQSVSAQSYAGNTYNTMIAGAMLPRQVPPQLVSAPSPVTLDASSSVHVPPTMQSVSAQSYSGNVYNTMMFPGTMPQHKVPPQLVYVSSPLSSLLPLPSLAPSVGLLPSVQSVSAQSYFGNMYNTVMFLGTMPQHQVPPPLVHVPSPANPLSPSDHFYVVFPGNHVKKCYGCAQEFA